VVKINRLEGGRFLWFGSRRQAPAQLPPVEYPVWTQNPSIVRDSIAPESIRTISWFLVNVFDGMSNQ
jgi:hypothetical protein